MPGRIDRSDRMHKSVHPLKRKKPGRKKGPPTDTITIRVSKEHADKFKTSVASEDRRQWLERQIDKIKTP